MKNERLMTVRRWQSQFFDSLESLGKTFNTLKNYRSDIDYFISFIEKRKNKNLSMFKLDIAKEYSAYLDVRVKSSNSRRRKIQTLRIFCDYLMKNEKLNSNPFRLLPVSAKKLDLPSPVLLSEIQNFWNVIKKDASINEENRIFKLISLRNILIFILIYEGGLKVSDLCRLERKNIILGSPTRVMIVPEKKDTYSIPLPEIFNEYFRKYIKESSKIKFYNSHQNSNLLLFYANQYRILSGGMTPRGIEIIFKKISQNFSINNMTPKSLRQSCIYKWISLGHSETTIKNWLGLAPNYSLKLYEQTASHFNFNIGIIY